MHQMLNHLVYIWWDFLQLSNECISSYYRTGSGGDDVLSNLQNVFYHKTRRNTLVLLYNQDILLLDLDIRQTVSVISLDRSTCPFVDVSDNLFTSVLYVNILVTLYLQQLYYLLPGIHLLVSRCYVLFTWQWCCCAESKEAITYQCWDVWWRQVINLSYKRST